LFKRVRKDVKKGLGRGRGGKGLGEMKFANTSVRERELGKKQRHTKGGGAGQRSPPKPIKKKEKNGGRPQTSENRGKVKKNR